MFQGARGGCWRWGIGRPAGAAAPLAASQPASARVGGLCALFRRMAGAFWRVKAPRRAQKCPRSRVSGGGGNPEHGTKGFGGATHPQKNREMTEKACQVKGDTSQRRVTSPKRSEKAPQNSGTGKQRERYQNTYSRTHYKRNTNTPNTKSKHHHGRTCSPCSSSPWWWWWRQAHAAIRGSRSTHRHGCREMSRHHGGGWWMIRPHRGSA